MEYCSPAPSLGAEILKPIKMLQPIIPAIMHHHENFDGSGYPDGLKGEEIPFLPGFCELSTAMP